MSGRREKQTFLRNLVTVLAGTAGALGSGRPPVDPAPSGTAA